MRIGSSERMKDAHKAAGMIRMRASNAPYRHRCFATAILSSPPESLARKASRIPGKAGRSVKSGARRLCQCARYSKEFHSRARPRFLTDCVRDDTRLAVVFRASRLLVDLANRAE